MNTQAIPLETIGDNGKAPASRIKTAADARAIVKKVIEAGEERSRWNSKIKGQIDGNPPFDPNKLRANGQAWRTNVNFGEAKSAVSNALSPFYDLFAGARYYATVQTRYGNGAETRMFSDIITEEFDCTLRKYDGFDFNIQQMIYDFVTFGRGFLIWEDAMDWFFRCKPQHRVYAPDGTDAYSGNQDVLVIRERMRVHKLWGYIKNKDTAESVGWNVAAAVEAIKNAQPEIAEGTTFNYEYLQQQIKDRDITEGVRCSTIPLAYVLVREFDNSITLYIVEEHDAKKSNKDEAQVDNFIFEKKKYAEDLNQFIATFFHEIADGSWNGASGLGRDIFSMMAVKDRVKCAAFDLVFLRTGITLQAKTEDAHNKAGLIQMGGMNVIPMGFDVQQSTIMGDIESPFYADRYLDNTVASNTGVYRAQIDKPAGNPRTLGEVELQHTLQATLGQSAVNRFYLSLDKLYAEIFRRISASKQNDSRAGKLAKEFQKRCEDRGVPREAFEKVEYVRAYRNSGNGSVHMRTQALAQMVEIGAVQMFPESGRQHWVEDVVSVLQGQNMVERYVPRAAKLNLPDDQMAYALLENAALKIGAPVTVTPTQNNVIHAQQHLQAGAQAAASLEQGADMAEVAGFLDAIGAHTAIHLGEIAKDPTRKDALQPLEEQWKQLAQIHDQLIQKLQSDAESQAQEQQALAQREQEMNGDFQLALMQAKHKEAMTERKTNFAIQDKAKKTQANIALADAKTAVNIQLAARKARSSDKNKEK